MSFNLDIIDTILRIESSHNYNAIGSVVNTRGRGIALGIFQALPDTIERYMNRIPMSGETKRKLKEIVNRSRQATNARVFKQQIGTRLVEYFPPEVQDRMLVLYLLDIIDHIRDANTEIDYRDFIMSVHNGSLKGKRWWLNTRNLRADLTPSNPNIFENAYSYLRKGGINPYVPGYVTVGALREYIRGYFNNGSKTININSSGASTVYSVDIQNESSELTSSLSADDAEKNISINNLNRPTLTGGLTTIGDIDLFIPPTAIRVYQHNQVFNVEAIRQAGSAKLINGAPVTRIEMSLLFNGIDMINQQLRPLIAQFKQTPFTVLRNETAYYAFLDILRRNELIDEEDLKLADAGQPIPVVLSDISLNTIPGYPQLIQAYLSLDIFNHLPFVEQLRFWHRTGSAVKNAVYSGYRHNAAFNVTEMASDGSLILTEHESGDRVEINYPDIDPINDASDDPIFSHVYKKLYRTLLSEYQGNLAERYPSDQVGIMDGYTGNSQMILRYYSLNDRTIREENFRQLLKGISYTLQDILEVEQLAQLEGDGYKHRIANLLKITSIFELISNVRSTYYLYQELHNTTVELAHLYINKEDIPPAILNDVYVIDPSDASRLMNKPAAEVLNDILKHYQKIEDKDPAKAGQLKEVLGEMTVKLFLIIYNSQSAVKDKKGLQPTSLILSSDPNNFGIDTTLEGESYLTHTAFVSSISLSYRNKVVPMATLGYEIPAYQHMGSGEFQVTMQIKAPDESILRIFEDIQYSTSRIMRDQIARKRGFEHITHRIELISPGSLLQSLGIRHLTLKGLSSSSIEGSPGWFTIELDLVQDDVTAAEFNRLRLLASIDKQVQQDVMDYILPMTHDGFKKVAIHIANQTIDRLDDIKYQIKDTNYDKTEHEQWFPDLNINDEPVQLFQIEIDTDALNYLDRSLRKSLNAHTEMVFYRIQRPYVALQLLLQELYKESPAELNSALAELHDMYLRYLTVYMEFVNVVLRYIRYSGFNDNLTNIKRKYPYRNGSAAYDGSLNNPVDNYKAPLELPFDLLESTLLHNRLSIFNILTTRHWFQKLAAQAQYLRGTDNERSSLLAFYSEFSYINKAQQQASLSNYPDFALPDTDSTTGSMRVIGPAFPYVDIYTDSVFEKEYDLSDEMLSSAYYSMAAVVGKHELSGYLEQRENIRQFVDKLFSTEQFDNSGTIKQDIESVLDEVDKLNKQQDYTAYSTKLQRSRHDLLKLLRTRAVLRWYIVSRLLNPNGDGIVVDIVFPKDKETGKIDPKSVKVTLAIGGTIKESDLDSLITNALTGSADNAVGGDVAALKQALNIEGALDYEQVLGFIYQTKMDMIQLLNVDDPEAYTSFLGFTDSSAYEQRKNLHRQLSSGKRSSYHGSMYRAFPTIKIYFKKENENDWLLFDDFYNYNALIECNIVESKHAATSTAIIRLSNLIGRLTENSEWQDDLSNRDTPYRLDNLLLRVGTPVMIKAGYGPDHRNLRMLFYGAVTELRPGEIMELTAQSWAVGLTNPIDSGTEGMSISSTSAERSMGAAMLKVLSRTPGLKHFGRWSPGFNSTDTSQFSTTEAEMAWWIQKLPLFDFVATPVFSLTGDTGKQIQQYISQLYAAGTNGNGELTRWGNPLYDNIYLSANQNLDFGTQMLTFGLSNLFSGNSGFVWKIHNQNTWEALWEMCLFAGDFIVRPLPYNEFSLTPPSLPRYTLYVGPRNGYYKFTDNHNFTRKSGTITLREDLQKLLTDEEAAESGIQPWEITLLKRTVWGFFKKRFKQLIPMANNLRADSYWGLIFTDVKEENLTSILSHLKSQGFHSTVDAIVDFIKSSKDNFLSSGLYGWNKDPERFLKNILDRPKFTQIDLEGFDPASLSAELYDKYISELSKSMDNGYNGEYNLLLMFKRIATETLLDDIQFVLSDISTANYQEGLHGLPSFRKWLLDSKIPLISQLVDTFESSGLTNSHLYKPVVEHHFIDAYRDILDNQIIATADQMFNRVEVIFPENPTIHGPNVVDLEEDNELYRVTAELNPYLDPNYVRTYQTYQKNLRFNQWVEFLTGIDYSKYDPSEYDRVAMPLFRNVANQILMNVVKPMYQGNLTIIGNPNIKPWHIVHLYDPVNQMWGPVEVEQVVHSFNVQTGYTTTITPNAVVAHRNLREVWDTNYLSTFGSIDFGIAMAKTSIYGGLGGLATRIGIGASAGLITGGLQAAATGLSTAGSTAAAGFLSSGAIGSVTAAIPYLGWIAAAAVALYQGAEAMKSYYIGSILRVSTLGGWNPLTIVPLMYRGKPYLAGTEGAYWGDNVYSFIVGQIGDSPETALRVVKPYVNPAGNFNINEE